MYLDLISYAANSFLNILSTNLAFFEDYVPVIVDMYTVFVAIGWGLLIGNCVFQTLKSMLSGLGFEGESPVILVCRTAIFGFLLLGSRQICNILLGLGASVITLIGLPSDIAMVIPDNDWFGDLVDSWVLVIIVGFVLGFQLIKLFLEIGERYVVVAVLVLLFPLGIAMGGSRATRDICVGYVRTLGSMILMMVLNIVFLKLMLSALSSVPPGFLVLPWCILVVGISRTARKADNLISRIGLSPALTGDPLGHGGGRMAIFMAARTIIGVARRGGSAKKSGGSKMSTGMHTASASTHNNAQFANANYVKNQHTAGDSASRFSTSNVQYGAGVTNRQSRWQSSRSSSTAVFGGQATNMNTSQAQSTRFGSANYSGTVYQAGGSASLHSSANQSNVHFTGGTSINTNRFGVIGGRTPPSTGSRGMAGSHTPQTGAAKKAAYGTAAAASKTVNRPQKAGAQPAAQPDQSRFRTRNIPAAAVPVSKPIGTRPLGRFGSTPNIPRNAGSMKPGQTAKPGVFRDARPIPEKETKQEDTNG